MITLYSSAAKRFCCCYCGCLLALQVDVTRQVLDQYGAMQWTITFKSNPGETPPGAGNVPLLIVTQPGAAIAPLPLQLVQGSASLGGSFNIDYGDTVGGVRTFSFDETAER
jgi:hypothetical protein